MQLRPYQEEAVKVGVEFFNDPKKEGAVIVAPTGSGKSLLISNICHQLSGNTLILQPSLEILQSNKEKAEVLGITDIGVFSASAGRKDIGQITFATIKSIINRKDLLETFDRLIIDECHLVSAKNGQYKEIIEFFKGKVLGLTATPFRLHSYSDQEGNRSVVARFLTRTRPKLFHKIIHITQIGELYKQGYLCPVEYKVNNNYDPTEIKLNSTGADFDELSLELYNEKKGVLGIIEREITINKSKHILVFVCSINEALELNNKLRVAGITAAVIHAKTPKKERAKILEQFKSGDIKVVSNVQTMTTGYDFPALDCVILGRPTQSLSLFMQMVGRCMRIHPDKKIARVIDICNNLSRFGRINTFEIIDNNRKHRMKSDAHFLTGWDFVGNRDIEAMGYKGLKESKWNEHAVIMPFGKYKNTHISKIPTDYLRWMEKTFSPGMWKDKFTAELNRRSSLRPINKSELPF